MNAPPNPRVYAQWEREVLVGAFLDITVARFKEVLDVIGDEGVPEDLHQPLANAIVHLGGTADEPADGRLYLQDLVLLADHSLHTLVHLFGTDPFAAEVAS